MIEVRDITKRYGSVEAARGISFTARPGEATGCLGPNGAGKSTTIKIIAGLLKPTSGEVRVHGHDVIQSPLEAKRCIGYVPENASLYSTLSPREYLSLVGELRDLDRTQARNRMDQLFEAFEITAAVDRQIETLSKGMRQKVLIAGALIHDPEVLLLDEPLNGLDVNAALTLRRIMDGMIANGKTILYCSHILDVIERVCSRVVIIDNGLVVADDSTERLLAGNPDHTLEAVFQSLTRAEDADDYAKAFLKSLDSSKTPENRPTLPTIPIPAEPEPLAPKNKKRKR